MEPSKGMNVIDTMREATSDKVRTMGDADEAAGVAGEQRKGRVGRGVGGGEDGGGQLRRAETTRQCAASSPWTANA